MAMTRTLFSISALAVELGKDRRTVASVLDSVPSDGTIAGGHRGWFLTSALDAIDRGGKPAGEGPLAHYAGRLEAWREIHAADHLDMPINEAAEALGIDHERLLTWLRAGLPYVEAGDFETGDGFILRPAWVIDWEISLQCIARATGDRSTARKLQIG
jgi:hypothetical protein